MSEQNTVSSQYGAYWHDLVVGELTVQLHEFVNPEYILSLLNKRQGS